ncbi:hypothetical protein PINS_up005997 [Pythium insidiosum]|nr:hypothetical protein PINS_up005997 [Pythium insidiosum]
MVPLIPQQDQRIRIVAIGNPGVGKSTFLNCLANQPAFRSGLSYGTGLTKTAAMVAIQNFLLVDTPGLCDMTIEKNAALEITRVLRSGGLFKLLFFVRLESGRLVTDDLVTLSRVMDSLRGDFKCKFTVVINNILPSTYEKLKTRGEEYELMMRSLNTTKYVTPHVILNPLNAELDERDCAVATLPVDVHQAITAAPCLELTPSQVVNIDTSDHRAEAEKLRGLIEAQRQQIDRTRAANHRMRQREQAMAADATRAISQFADSEPLVKGSAPTYPHHNQTAAAGSFQSNYTCPKPGQTSGSYSMQEVACQPAQKMSPLDGQQIYPAIAYEQQTQAAQGTGLCAFSDARCTYTNPESNQRGEVVVRDQRSIGF